MLRVYTKTLLLVLCIALITSGCASFNLNKKSLEIAKARAKLSENIIPISNITLMLPLGGKNNLAFTSQAIRNGFLAAYDYSRKQQHNVNIRVIDTAGSNISSLYTQAIADGANIVVGPLTKQEVGVIVNNISFLPIPVIALNTLDNYRYNFKNNAYQFGLSPFDEIIQAALKIRAEKKSHVAVISPNDGWGGKLYLTFKEQFEAHGGKVVANLNYNINQYLNQQICNFLVNDPKQICTPQLKTKHQKNRYESLLRPDIDSIFLVTKTPEEARQIVPLLKFYYASGIPIYSISNVYSGSYNIGLDQDIEGVIFCDMPWVLKNPDYFATDLRDIYTQIIMSSDWADSFAKYIKFYALGIDSYNLAFSLNELLKNPTAGINGATGVLYLDKFNHIYRGLEWAKIRGGKPEI